MPLSLDQQGQRPSGWRTPAEKAPTMKWSSPCCSPARRPSSARTSPPPSGGPGCAGRAPWPGARPGLGLGVSRMAISSARGNARMRSLPWCGASFSSLTSFLDQGLAVLARRTVGGGLDRGHGPPRSDPGRCPAAELGGMEQDVEVDRLGGDHADESSTSNSTWAKRKTGCSRPGPDAGPRGPVRSPAGGSPWP